VGNGPALRSGRIDFLSQLNGLAVFGGWVFLANKIRLGPGFTANQKALLAFWAAGFSQPIISNEN
jgi:hypothetical protein